MNYPEHEIYKLLGYISESPEIRYDIFPDPCAVHDLTKLLELMDELASRELFTSILYLIGTHLSNPVMDKAVHRFILNAALQTWRDIPIDQLYNGFRQTLKKVHSENS